MSGDSWQGCCFSLLNLAAEAEWGGEPLFMVWDEMLRECAWMGVGQLNVIGKDWAV
jgi:hypothetical protein